MAGIPPVPPGLEPLLQTDMFYVKETRHSTFQSCATYDLLSADGSLVYTAEEVKECCRPRLNVWIQDLQGFDVLQVLLPWSCRCGVTMQVISLPSGSPLGYIDRSLSSFTMLTPGEEQTVQVRNAEWTDGFFSDVNYMITPYGDKTPLGAITRLWRGFKKEFFSSTDHYAIQFPIDLDVKIKALTLACALFIDVEQRERRLH